MQKLYIPAIREACFELIAEGKLPADLPSVQAVLVDSQARHYDAALFNLGLPRGFSLGAESSDGVLLGLTQIGSQGKKQVQVDENHKKVFSFKKLGDEWSERIATLWRVVTSKKLNSLDKLVAYGALFYLLTPIDFIPDQIPFIGLTDDFCVLGIAAAYYTKKFTKIP